MYKITYVHTGHVFELPDEAAQDLKNQFPEDYKILEKNGKKFRDKLPKKKETDAKSIYSKVVESEG